MVLDLSPEELKAALATFREESAELLAQLEAALLALEETPGDMELVAQVFRVVHTIKGNSRMFGLTRVEDLSHRVESVFDRVRKGGMPLTREITGLVLEVRDELWAQIASAENPEGESASGRAELLAARFGELATLPGVAPSAATGEEPTTFRIRFRMDPETFRRGLSPLPLLNDLKSLGGLRVLAQTDGVPPLEEMDPGRCYLSWDALLTTSRGPGPVEEVFARYGEVIEKSLETVDRADGPDADDKKLGEILLEKGDLDPEALRVALKAKGRLGEKLITENMVDPMKIQSALMEQEVVREARRRRTSTEAAFSVRVPSRRLDRLVNLVGELVTAQSRLAVTAARRADPELLALSEQVERLTSDLREGTFSLRMTPIETLFGMFHRLVRDLSLEVGKEIDFAVEGEKTELDKTLIERLGDPLMHMIRNGIDHGIETAEFRTAVGKPPRGRIRLSAAHAGANIVIRLEDDGAGLNRNAIRAKARELGFIGSADDPPDHELFPFILRSGFSTAREVSSVSGRGVGMDVVRKSIEELRGSLTIESRPGQGTAFTITLPLTLAIIQGLLVGVGEELYVLPLDQVRECVELREGDASPGGGQLLLLRGEVVPYIRLREWFGVEGDKPALEQVVVAVTDSGQRVGLAVDRVVGEQQTVVKGLGRLLGRTEGLTGATVLGDGSLALILDVSRLAGLAGKAGEEVARWTAEG